MKSIIHVVNSFSFTSTSKQKQAGPKDKPQPQQKKDEAAGGVKVFRLVEELSQTINGQ
jgi:hypothetical protein